MPNWTRDTGVRCLEHHVLMRIVFTDDEEPKRLENGRVVVKCPNCAETSSISATNAVEE